MTDDPRRFYPAGWFDGPLAVVTRSYVRIHRRAMDEPWWDDNKALAEWLRGLVAEGIAKRQRTPRGYVKPAIWQAILDEFDHRCAYCGASDIPLEKDHRIAITRGGADDPSNLVPACKPCNIRKFNHDPADWPIRFGRLNG